MSTILQNVRLLHELKHKEIKKIKNIMCSASFNKKYKLYKLFIFIKYLNSIFNTLFFKLKTLHI